MFWMSRLFMHSMSAHGLHLGLKYWLKLSSVNGGQSPGLSQIPVVNTQKSCVCKWVKKNVYINSWVRAKQKQKKWVK